MRLRARAMMAASALALGFGLAVTPSPASAPPAQAGIDFSPGSKDVIVHLFQWPWSSVASECTNVLGPKGFGGVQVSPPQEHVVLPGQGFPWWQDYQPVSYQLDSRRGDRADFADMVQACHDAGVKVYVDAVVNHMAGGASSGPGSAGSSYSHYEYPVVPHGYNDFHHCGRNGNDDIADWTDHWEVRNCELLDLSDLKTGSSHVRSMLAAYLDDLRSLGVDGFRIDAGKHVPVADLQAILSSVNGSPYVFHEVIEGGPGEISPTEYTGIGDVTEFRYGDVVGNAFADGNLSNLNNLADSMLLDSSQAVVFIDNHDTQRNGRAKLTYEDGANYALAEAFMLAWPYGVPKVMSSFDFSSHDQGPPATSGGITTPVTCDDGWACEHRWRTTANLVEFRNTVQGAGVTDWWTNGSDLMAFGRGDKGYVAFNHSDSTVTRPFHTSLPAGTYCDVAGGDVDGGTCTGPSYTVNADGWFTASVAAGSMLALHVNATTGSGSCTSVDVSFAVDATTVWGENVHVVGNRSELGNWNTNNGVALSAATYPIWRGTIELPKSVTFEYKYIKKTGSGEVIWESGANRVQSTGTTCSVTSHDTWRN